MHASKCDICKESLWQTTRMTISSGKYDQEKKEQRQTVYLSFTDMFQLDCVFNEQMCVCVTMLKHEKTGHNNKNVSNGL